MGLIVLRPEELARLAQRLDAGADDMYRSAGRLDRSLAPVSLNRADEQFPLARFNQRSALVRASLRRLADATRSDAALLASTADDGDVADDSGVAGGRSWLGALLGLTPASHAGTRALSDWSATAAGLGVVQPLRSGGSEPLPGSSTGSVTPAPRPVSGAGGLFAAAARPPGESEAELGAWLGSLPTPGAQTDGPDAVWDRVSDELGWPARDD